ncbi:MAG TPA: hypothetical protein VLZ75_01995 [Chitinophagales bacterium]|nr:hypothetical protein [Chitinophagales bacterium]
MKYILSIITFTITILYSNIYAQIPKSFAEDDAGFINTFTTYLSSNNRPEAKESAAWLKANLTSKASSEDLAQIKATANVMLLKKVPLWPRFNDYAIYLKTIGEQSNLDAAIISQNHKILLQFLEKEGPDGVKQFYQYMEYLTTHYSKKAIYSDRVKAWYTTQFYTIKMEEGSPIYVFEKMDLTGETSSDSIIIKNTSGKFNPMTNQWNGKSGNISWRRVGYNSDDVFVDFKDYQMDLSKAEIVIDTVEFTFKPYVKAPIKGKFEDKLFTSKSVASNYPQFASFDKVALKISDNVLLESGIILEGIKLFTTATGRAEPAKLTIFDKKKEKIIEAEASKYFINDFKQIEGTKAKVNFAFLDSTSIFHPSSTLSYNVATKNLKVTRENTNDARIPFVAPFFKMIVYVDQFEWNIDSNYADINSTAVNAKLPAYFESFEYYVPGVDVKYQQSIGMDPIGNLATYCESVGYDRLSIDEVARVWNKSGYKAIEPLVFKLMEDGYMYYDRETSMIDVYDKLFLHAKIREDEENTNYDNIRLASITQGKVGKLLIDQKKFEIYGAGDTKISNKSNITINPSSDTIYISKNRGIVYKGRLSVGKFNYYSDSIEFKYDENLFNLKKIDSMLIMVPLEQTDSRGNQYFTEINTPIEKISGKIYISDPEHRNKSTKYTVFPYFDCNDTSIVSFDKSKYGDRYPTDDFKFKIYPFKLEQLANIDTENMKFKGLLQSGGIFKDLETNLLITKDRTLGLDIEIDPNGLEVFKGKGTVFGHLLLDNDGLTFKGKISKENLNFYTDSTLILPDSIHANLTNWEAIEAKDMIAPILSGAESVMNWNPINDSIHIQPKAETEVSFYNKNAIINGNFQITNNQLKGAGKITIGETEIKSDSIILKPQHAEINQFALAVVDNAYKVFTSSTADIQIDFEKLEAKIQIPKDSTAKYNFNYLTTNNSDFIWNIKNKTIAVNEDNSKGKHYTFVDNKLKDIQLSATHSIFELPNRNLKLFGISQILVADSKIIPNKGELTIAEGGEINTLDSATLVMNADSSFHTITPATVEIIDKNHVKGDGVFPIQTGNNTKKAQLEYFKTVEVEEEKSKKEKNPITTYYTIAKGNIEESESFHLSDNLLYKGSVSISSLSNEIQLDGFAQPLFKSIPNMEWFKVKQSLDLEKSSIQIDSMKNELGQDIYTGLMLDLNEFMIYPRIIQSKLTSTDRPIYAASGFMKSDEVNDEISFGNLDALKKPTYFKPLMKFNEVNENIEVVGNFNLAKNIEPVLLDIYGKATYSSSDNSPFTINGTLALDAYLTPDIANLFTRFMTDFNTNAVYLNLIKNNNLSFAVTRLIKDPGTASIVEQDMVSSAILNLPQSFPYNMVFSDMKMSFDRMDGTFKSVDQLSMLVFAGKAFTQKIKGYIEIGPRNTQDFINLYLTTSSGDWIFMRYINGELSVVSSDNSLNSSLSSIKEDKRSIKSGKEVVYKIIPASPALKDNFILRMEEYKEQILNK